MTRKILGGCLALLGAVASVPAFLVAFNPMVWMFQTSFEVINQSGEVVYVTPVGVVPGSPQRWTLPLSWWSIPMIPRADCGDFRLPPGSTKVFRYDWDDINFSEVVVRNDLGSWHQFVVLPEATAQPCCGGPALDRIFVPPLAQLPLASPAAREAATAGRVNNRVRLFYLSYAAPLLSLGGVLIAGRRLFTASTHDAKPAV